jgi:ABC-type sugar transport system permease subunit
VQSIRIAFQVTSCPRGSVVVCLGNFRILLKDPDFRIALKNTSVFALFSVFVQLPLSLGLVLPLNARNRQYREIALRVFGQFGFPLRSRR